MTAVILLLAACGGGAEEADVPDVVESEPVAEVETDPEPVEEAEPEAEEEVMEEPTEEPVEEVVEEPTPTVEPTPAAPTVSWAPGEYIISNGNKVRDVALFDNAIWAPSTGGLVRYDLTSGESRKYTTADGLPNIGTFSVEVCPIDGNDRLIVGYRDGLVLYDAASDGWEPGETIGYNDDTAIHEMRCDAANNRLVLSYDDLSVLDLTTNSFTHYTEDDDGLAWFTAEQVIIIGDDIWMPTDFKGFSRIGMDGTVETFNEENGLPDNNVSDIVLGADGTYWLAASDGLIQWQNGTYTVYDRDTHPDLIDFFGPSHIETAVDGTIWLGFNSDLCRFDPTTITCSDWQDLEDDLGFPDGASIARLEATEEGGMLLHTYDEGVAYFDGSGWTRYALEGQAPDNYFEGLFESTDGTIWAYGNGLYMTDLEMTGWERFSGTSTNDIADDSEGNLWFVSGQRVGKFDGAQLTFWEEEDGVYPTSYRDVAVSEDGVVYAVGSDGYTIIDGDTITAVGEESGWDFGSFRDVMVVDGIAYAATTDGLVTLDGESWTVILDESFVALPDENIGAMAQLSDGTLLLGTTRGLAMYKDGTVTAVDEVAGSVQDIFVTEDDQIHLVSQNSDGGYYHHDSNGWSFKPAEEFPMTSLRAVIVDAAGTVWIGLGDSGLGGGLVRIVPEQ